MPGQAKLSVEHNRTEEGASPALMFPAGATVEYLGFPPQHFSCL